MRKSDGSWLFVFFGFIASGKSTLAKAFAIRHGLSYFNTDVVRKELAGKEPTAREKDRYEEGLYTRKFTQKTYAAVAHRAEEMLRQGSSVVLDGSYQARVERERLIEMTSRLAISIRFILCVCPEEEMKARMARRALESTSVSDGRWEIYLKQKERFEEPDELPAESLMKVDTTKPVEEILAEIDNKLQQ